MLRDVCAVFLSWFLNFFPRLLRRRKIKSIGSLKWQKFLCRVVIFIWHMRGMFVSDGVDFYLKEFLIFKNLEHATFRDLIPTLPSIRGCMTWNCLRIENCHQTKTRQKRRKKITIQCRFWRWDSKELQTQFKIIFVHLQPLPFEKIALNAIKFLHAILNKKKISKQKEVFDFNFKV